MPWGATQDGQVIVKSSDETWSPEGGNDKPLQCSCLEKPVNSMKRQKDVTPENEPPRLEGAQYATGEEQKVKSAVAQLCPTLCDPMDCSPPGSSTHEIFQARVLEWGVISFSRGSL